MPLSPAIPLTLFGRPVETVFDLLGRKENDLTFSLGWALANSPALLSALLADVFAELTGEPTSVALQHFAEDGGHTDIDITAESARLIVEAKRGWVIPSDAQLERYVGRFEPRVPAQLLVLTECSDEFAVQRGLPEMIGDVPVVHRSWRWLVTLVREAIDGTRGAQRQLLAELLRYLRGVITMQDQSSNWAYVVSLGAGSPEGATITWKDVVVERRQYFHLYGAGHGWPKLPPNYMAFRWDGRLQQINHVDGYQVVADLHDLIPEIPPQDHTDIVYSLGDPIYPPKLTPTGPSIVRSNRVWAALDLLLTCSTISEAWEKSIERQGRYGEDRI